MIRLKVVSASARPEALEYTQSQVCYADNTQFIYVFEVVIYTILLNYAGVNVSPLPYCYS